MLEVLLVSAGIQLYFKIKYLPQVAGDISRVACGTCGLESHCLM